MTGKLEYIKQEEEEEEEEDEEEEEEQEEEEEEQQQQQQPVPGMLQDGQRTGHFLEEVPPGDRTMMPF